MFMENMKKLAKDNENFREVIQTGDHCQLVLMSIPIGEEIGEETHRVDQVLFFVDGEGEAILNNESRAFEEHDVVFVPAGTRHNIKNTGDELLKFFTIYAPPQHKDGTIHKTKADADADEHDQAPIKVAPSDYLENM